MHFILIRCMFVLGTQALRWLFTSTSCFVSVCIFIYSMVKICHMKQTECAREFETERIKIVQQKRKDQNSETIFVIAFIGLIDSFLSCVLKISWRATYTNSQQLSTCYSTTTTTTTKNKQSSTCFLYVSVRVCKDCMIMTHIQQ